MNKCEWVLDCRNVTKTFDDGHLKVDVLKDITFGVGRGESVGIIGASGSGKSTLLHLLGGLDVPTSGSVRLAGTDFQTAGAKAAGILRNRYLGFVYQFHHLLPEFSALENVMMPLLIARVHKDEAADRAAAMLARVGLKERVRHRPAELSGGERQRAAVARALINQPACILADEPTGNLDRQNARNVLDLMLDLKQESDTALVVVTHDDILAKRFDTVLSVADGSVSGAAA